MVDKDSKKDPLDVLELISGQSSVLTIPKIYIYLLKDRDKALVFSQIIFWQSKSTDLKDGWFHKSYEEWEEETTIPERTMRRIIDSLKEKGLIESRSQMVKGKKRLVIKLLKGEVNKQINELLTHPDKVAGWRKKETKSCTNLDASGQSGRINPDKVAGSYIEHNPLSQLKDNDVTHTQNSSCPDAPIGDIVSPPQQTGVTVYQETYFPMPVEAVAEISLDWLLKNNPYQLPPQMISDWIIIRKKKKSAVTFTAWNQLNKELNKLEILNKNPIDMFELAVANGWATLKAEWFADNKPGRNTKAKEYDHQSIAWGNGVKDHFKRKGM
jgi:hypothetical protein